MISSSWACTLRTCRSGVMLDQDEHGNAAPGSTCIRCDRVDGFPCLVNGKADAQTVCVDPALGQSQRRPDDQGAVERLETEAAAGK